MSDEDQTTLAINYQLITRHTNYLLTYIRPEEEKATDLPELQKVAQMLAAGWSGAGTSKDMSGPQVLFSRSRQSFDASYDLPRVFRSTANSKITAQECDDECNSLEDFAAPAKASKQRAQRPLTLDEIIILANKWIQNPADIEKFIKAIQAQLIDANLTSLLNQLSPLLSDKDVWTVILSWLLIDSRTKDRWKPKTRLAIEAMANELPKDQLKTSLVIVNSHRGTLFNGPLSVEGKSAWNPINWLRKLAD
jgi:hypothetical protein